MLSILLFPTIVLAVDCTELADYPNTEKVCEALDEISVILMWLGIALAVLLIIIAGIQYIISAGDEEKIKKAKKTIVNGLIGVAIILLAAFLVNLVGEIIITRFDLL